MPTQPLRSSPAPSLSAPPELWLPGLGPAARLHHVFLALRPDAAACTTITELSERLRARHGLGQKPPPEHLHVALHSLGHFSERRDDLVRAVSDAVAALTTATFPVSFDRIFHSRPANAVLLGAASDNSALQDFHQQLARALLHAGLGRHIRPAFTPHLTLLHDAKAASKPLDPPITWTATDFVLLDIVPDDNAHSVLGSWPLADRSNPA